MIKSFIVVSAIFLTSSTTIQQDTADKQDESLIGPVRTVQIKVASLSNKSGRLAEGKLKLKRSLSYDRNGNLVEQTLYDDGVTVNRTRYTYISKEVRYEEVQMPGVPLPIPGAVPMDLALTLRHKADFNYDSGGNRTEKTVYDSDGGLSYRMIYNYENGRMTEKTRFNFKGKSKTELVFKRVYTYDAQGHMVEEAEYTRDGSMRSKVSYDYDSDNNGNWIKRTTHKWTTKNGKSLVEPQEIMYRIITYY